MSTLFNEELAQEFREREEVTNLISRIKADSSILDTLDCKQMLQVYLYYQEELNRLEEEMGVTESEFDEELDCGDEEGTILEEIWEVEVDEEWEDFSLEGIFWDE